VYGVHTGGKRLESGPELKFNVPRAQQSDVPTIKSKPWTALLNEKRIKTTYNRGGFKWMRTCLTGGGADSSVPPPCSQGDWMIRRH
jgi:hypothetical protein